MNTVEWKVGKQLRVEISRSALLALEKRSHPIYLVLELYFSCLIRKRVLISEDVDREREYLSIHDLVEVNFAPVMTKACSMDSDTHPELVAFPIKKPDAYLPKWLRLDFQHGKFVGEFGY